MAMNNPEISTIEDYDTTVAAILENHAPMQSRTVSVRNKCKWFDSEVKKIETEKKKG